METPGSIDQRGAVHGRRNHLFDVFRLIFALLVLLSHAPELTDGNSRRELFNRVTHSGLTFGTVAVDGFFLLSGYLIVQSRITNPDLFNFLRKRLLRIVPGYLVAVFLSTLVIGLVAPAAPGFFLHIGKRFWGSIAMLNSPITPPVLAGLHYPIVNGSLWTITYEFRCYLLVALFGVLGLFRRPIYWLCATVLLSLAKYVPFIETHVSWSKHMFVYGDPDQVYRMFGTFFIGGCFYLYRDRIRFSYPLASIAIIALVCFFLIPFVPELALVTFGAYLLFYLGSSGLGYGLKRFPDVSYGVYLYGWPVEALWIWFYKGSPWVTFLLSAFITLGLGWLSWHFIERPALTLKRKGLAPLPAG